MVVKLNPQNSKFYFKTGLNLSNQKLFGGDNAYARVNQHSVALAGGYLLKDDLYAEVGLSNTKLNGKNIGSTYLIADEITKLGYVELAKRMKTDIGTVDTNVNAGKSFYEFKDNEKSYGICARLLPKY
ncbi:hypothetical protein [Abyssogena phaseoliformis symbiont]|uniref:hypothetical protein n=1 Tax=Abyssogena phaseoliformis symbiont TaxID=596095 RepID=UPI001915856C|nr:hypothetical protein [Abyssogena phaseoliformis symbiont]